MKKIFLSIIVILLFNFSFSQDKLLTFEKNDYSINYPDTWKLDTSGQMDSEFILFSALTSNDEFRENINLVIQDLGEQKMTMPEFVKLSESQIKAYTSNGKVIESKGDNFSHSIVFSGFVANNDLKFKQLYFLKNNKIYVITFTALENSYDSYLKTGNEILYSFKLK